MLKIFSKRKAKKGQNVAEYAILIALVVGAVIAMQRFAQRGLQARIFDATKYLTTQTNGIGKTGQYEPDTADTQYQVTRDTTDTVSARGYQNYERDMFTGVTRDGTSVIQLNAAGGAITGGLEFKNE